MTRFLVKMPDAVVRTNLESCLKIVVMSAECYFQTETVKNVMILDAKQDKK